MRVKRGIVSKRRHNKVFKQAEGFRGRRKNVFKLAKDAVERSLSQQFVGRKLRKRDFRRLWITRINAAVREYGMSYSVFMNGLVKANIEIDRRVLADLAVREKESFGAIAERVKKSLQA